MKKLFVLLIAFAACSSPKEKDIPLAVLTAGEDEWEIYEGKIITDKGLEVDVELFLMKNTVGVDSYYKLSKNVPFGSGYNSNSKGTYSVSYSLPNHEQGITISEPPVETYTVVDDQMTKEQKEEFNKREAKFDKINSELATPELYFRTDGMDRLIQTNRNFDSKGSKFTLNKRSDLFTVEGYLTCEDTSTEFFERNTRKTWSVSSFGQADSAKSKYAQLATQKWEGVYLKALAYSIPDATSESNRLLVIKELLRMEKSSFENRIE